MIGPHLQGEIWGRAGCAGRGRGVTGRCLLLCPDQDHDDDDDVDDDDDMTMRTMMKMMRIMTMTMMAILLMMMTKMTMMMMAMLLMMTSGRCSCPAPIPKTVCQKFLLISTPEKLKNIPLCILLTFGVHFLSCYVTWLCFMSVCRQGNDHYAMPAS